jgi:hypothetical protein
MVPVSRKKLLYQFVTLNTIVLYLRIDFGILLKVKTS